VGQATLVISGPVTARLLGPTGRGDLALLLIVTVICSTLGGAGLPSAVAYGIARHSLPARGVLRVIRRTWLALSLAAAVASAAAVILLERTLPGSSLALTAGLVALWVVSIMAWKLMQACIQGEHHFALSNWLLSLSPVLSAIVLLCVFLWRRHAPVSEVLGVLVVTNVAACIIGGFAAASVLRPNPVALHLTVRPLLRYGFRSLAGTSAPVDTFSVDQALVGLALSRHQLGLYAVAGAFNNLPSLFVNGIATIALPRIAAESDNATRNHLIARIALAAVLVGAAASVFAEVIVAWALPFAFGSGFSGAVPVARVLIVAGFFLAVRRMLVVFLQASGRPGETTVGELIALVALTIAAGVLVPTLGLIGGGLALILAALVADSYLTWALRTSMVRPAESPGERRAAF
jgi:O-antigen/teichoic acid export membrane protein